MKYIIFVIIILCSNSYTQHFHGTFSEYRHPDTMLYLYDFIDLAGNAVDSCRVDKQGKFSFKVREYNPGLYQMRGTSIPPLYFILNPAEDEVEAKILKNGNKVELFFIQSKENQAYHEYFQDLVKTCSDLEQMLYLQKFHDSDPATKIRNQTVFANTKRHLQERLSYLESDFQGTITHNAIMELIPNMDESYNIRLDNYFKSKSILDATYLRTPLVYHKLTNYLEFYSGANKVDLGFSLDDILLLASEGELSYIKCVTIVLGYLERRNEWKRIEYIVKEYLGDELDIIDNPQLRRSIEGRSKLKMGVTVPDMFIPNQDNESVSLHTLIKKSEVTLLMFWSSVCSHCKAGLPKIIELYDNYRSSGFNVVAISLDKDGSAWKDAIKAWNMEWDNLSELKGWSSESTDLYFITTTPSFYLLNNNQKIIGRPINTGQLNHQIRKLFERQAR